MISNAGLIRSSTHNRRSILLSSGFINPQLNFTRTSTATGIVNGNLTEFLANAPRWVDATGGGYGLLLEGARTNSIRNPRAEGAVAGTPGTMPTNWLLINIVSGLTQQIVGTGTENNIPYLDVRVFGTPATSTYINIIPDSTIAAAQNQTWSSSVFCRLVGGSLTNTTPSLELRESNSAGAFLANSLLNITPTSAALSSQKYTVSRTLTNALTAFAAIYVNIQITSGLPIDITLRVGGPQLELGPTATSLILPPVGAPAASARAIDKDSTPLAGLALPTSGRGTYLITATAKETTSTGYRCFFQIDDDTGNNRYIARFDPGDANLKIYRVTAGLGTGAISVGPITANVSFKVAIAIPGNGEIRVSLGGSAVVFHTGGPTSGLTNIKLGIDENGTYSFYGLMSYVNFSQNVMTDAQLQALSA